MQTRPVLAMIAATLAVAVAATPSDASTMTYNFAVRIGTSEVFAQDFTLQSVQPGDVLHGTMTVDTSLPDINGSPDVGQYLEQSAPAVLSLTMGPYGGFPQETFSTSSFNVRIAENGRGFFGAEEIFILSEGSFVANGDQVDGFEIRLDSDSLSFLSGTDFPTAVNLGLLNSHSTFEFFGHDAHHPLDGFQLFGSITQFEVQRDVVPEPGSLVLLGSGLLTLSAVVLDRRRQRGRCSR